MEYKVVVAPRAIDDLRDIVLYISPDRPEAARRVGFALVEKSKALGRFPFAGRVVPEFDEHFIRELILNPYRIVYRVEEGTKSVGIARYWHGARGDLHLEDLKE